MACVRRNDVESKDMAIIPLYYSPKWVADVIANIGASRKLRTK